MTTAGPTNVIYMDHNATIPIAPEVLDVMLPYLKEQYGNPSSDHLLGRYAREVVEDTRERVAALIGADSTEVVFTFGGTESNNLAIRGSTAAAGPASRAVVDSCTASTTSR